MQSSSQPSDHFTRLRQEVVESLDSQITETLKSLPAEYTASVSEPDQIAQIKAVLAARICDIEQEITLRQRKGDRVAVTVVSRQNYAGFLAQLIPRLADEGDLLGAQIFSSVDNQFVIDIFEFGSESHPRKDRELSKSETDIVNEVAKRTGASKFEIEKFLARYRPENELLSSPTEIARQYLAFEKREHPNDLSVIWEVDEANPEASPGKLFAKVVVSSGNATTREVFTRAAEFFAIYRIDIVRAFCENVWLAEHDQVALLNFHICIEEEDFAEARQQFHGNCSDTLDGDVLRELLLDFLRVDQEVIANRQSIGTSLAARFGDLLVSELFCAFSTLVHQLFQLEMPRERVMHLLLQQHAMTATLLQRFIQRFESPKEGDSETLGELRFDMIADPAERHIFRLFSALVDGIDRCNLNMSDRRALAMRIPGSVFSNLSADERPHCVFFLYGCGFEGFHVRFRDVARGGMRIVRTRNAEHHLFESARAFDEVYRLATAQQLKNKDIAEGGAKALIVLRPEVEPLRAGHDFIDGILDMLVGGEQVAPFNAEPVDDEFLYFGPDENVSNHLIDWFVERAAKRGYPFPNSIISSKPSTGINHKEFGVTSEGVIVFLHQALVENEIDTNSPFTIKLTGGTDGDVGGNAVRILIRDFGTNAKIVAIADGTGAAHDPAGLDHHELLRLVEEGLGVAHFNAEHLSRDGRVADLSTEENIAWRNSLHFVVPSDVFIPAGGRPSAINEHNWMKFFNEQDKPISKLIVEGANLFITDSAREELSRRGVVIVKDSSANKCGVICSSLEIISAMLLSESEIVAIRQEFISETIELLRSLARIEAICLFNEQTRDPDRTLPQISVLISQQIIRVADEITANFEDWSSEEKELAKDYIRSFLPDSLIQAVGDDIADKIPPVYRRQLIASIISSQVVYREGWRNLAHMQSPALARLIRREMAYERKVRGLIKEVEASSLADKDRIISVLEHAGSRTHRELNL
ncbi:MAG: NAD-glutamate dehydrogenase domain-containing protein [Aureliella sp.]